MLTSEEIAAKVMAQNPNTNQGWQTIIAVPKKSDGRESPADVECAVVLSRVDDGKLATHYAQERSNGTIGLLSGNYFHIEYPDIDTNPDPDRDKTLEGAMEAAVINLAKRAGLDIDTDDIKFYPLSG